MPPSDGMRLLEALGLETIPSNYGPRTGNESFQSCRTFCVRVTSASILFQSAKGSCSYSRLTRSDPLRPLAKQKGLVRVAPHPRGQPRPVLLLVMRLPISTSWQQRLPTPALFELMPVESVPPRHCDVTSAAEWHATQRLPGLLSEASTGGEARDHFFVGSA